MEQSRISIFSTVKGDLTLLLVTAIGEYAFSRVAYALTAGFRWGYLVESTASMRAAATTVSAWAGIQLVTLWLIYRAITEADHVREPLAEAAPGWSSGSHGARATSEGVWCSPRCWP